MGSIDDKSQRRKISRHCPLKQFIRVPDCSMKKIKQRSKSHATVSKGIQTYCTLQPAPDQN
jgi:hypothetical protein